MTATEPAPVSYWYPLWKHMHDEHGLILLESECAEIADAVDAARKAEPATESFICSDCGKPLKPKKSWGGLMACYCRWNGRKPTARQIERDMAQYEKELSEKSFALRYMEATGRETK